MTLMYIVLVLFILSLALTPTVFNNPVRSVIAFITVFLFIAFILISIDIEFLAYVYAIVYIGAVAVLFLFVVMFLKVATKYEQPLMFYWVIFLASYILLISYKLINVLINQISLNWLCPDLRILLPFESVSCPDVYTGICCSTTMPLFTDMHRIANKFYNLFDMLFITTGFVLLVALLAVIILVIRTENFK